MRGVRGGDCRRCVLRLLRGSGHSPAAGGSRSSRRRAKTGADNVAQQLETPAEMAKDGLQFGLQFSDTHPWGLGIWHFPVGLRPRLQGSRVVFTSAWDSFALGRRRYDMYALIPGRFRLVRQIAQVHLTGPTDRRDQ